MGAGAVAERMRYVAARGSLAVAASEFSPECRQRMVTSRCCTSTHGRPENHAHDYVEDGGVSRHPARRRLCQTLLRRGLGTRELRHVRASMIRITLVRGPKGRSIHQVGDGGSAQAFG